MLLVLAAGARLSAYVGATVGEIGFLRGFWMDGSRRLAWLEDYAAAVAAAGDLPAPDRLTRGMRFDHVSFAYPGTTRLVLDDVSLDLPAGAVVAIVGENGAGKTTLVKLLAKMYEPSSGSILIDDVPLARMPADEPGGRDWPVRSRISSASNSCARQRSALATSARLDDEPAVRRGRRARRRGRRRRTACRRASTRSSGRRGPAAWNCLSDNGRSSRWPEASCATSRCC